MKVKFRTTNVDLWDEKDHLLGNIGYEDGEYLFMSEGAALSYDSLNQIAYKLSKLNEGEMI